MKKHRLTLYIGVGMALGLVAGALSHLWAADPVAAGIIAQRYALLTDIFLRLIKMIIAPLVLSILVSGLAGMHGGREIGRIGLRSIAWFIGASVVSLALGLVLANALQPGAGMHLHADRRAIDASLHTAGLNARDVILKAFPTSLIDAMSRNDIIEIVVFSLFFGLALNARKGQRPVDAVIEVMDGLVPVMLKLTNTVMLFAPIGVFGALAAAVTVKGLDILLTYGRLIGAFYLGLAVLWAIMLMAGAAVLGRRVLALVMAIREPALIAFSTASSEAAFPRLTEKLEEFGVDNKVVGLTLPLGYAFNLDGSMMYVSFASIFIAQAYGVGMSVWHQVAMLLVLMISSKGIAGVPRGAVVVIAAIAPMFGLPIEGIALILAVDQILDMGRTMTNVLGNSIATAAVAHWEARADGATAARRPHM